MQLIISGATIMLICSIKSIYAGSVGECRSECLERNNYKIVRVHLSEDLVHAGACQNVSTTNATDGQSTPKSKVFPFVCDRKIGVWEVDEQDEEGIVDFNVQCPQVEEVQPEVLESCPKK